MKKVSLTVINDLSTDQRVHKVAMSLIKAGYSPILIGRKLPDSLPLKPRSYKTLRMRLLFKKGPLFYTEYNFRLFIYLIFNKIDSYLAVDLDTLPANFLVSRITRKPLFYDCHEYFTEVPELVNRKFTKNIWLKIENFILPKLKNCVTVCQSIADVYYKMYGVKFTVVRNVPLRFINLNTSLSNIYNNFNLPDKKILIYQGALNIGRGIELMIKTMSFLDNCILVIIGNGDIALKIRELTRNDKLEQKIFFIGRVAHEELVNYTQHAFLGLSLEEDLGLNYRFALPNKLFDYIQSNVPVVVSNLPEMQTIVNQYNIGQVIDDRNPQSISEIITNIINNPEIYNKWKENLKIAANELCWEREEEKLIKLFINS